MPLLTAGIWLEILFRAKISIQHLSCLVPSRSKVFYDLGRHEEAIAAYRKASELDPKDAYPWNGLGIVYHDLGRHEEAVAAY